MNRFKEIKCLAIDIDGTLTDEKGRINLKAIEMMRRIKEKLDIKIILASGNTYPVMMGLARYISGIDILIAENGGIVGYGKTKQIIGDPTIGERGRELIKKHLNEILTESWQNEYRLSLIHI